MEVSETKRLEIIAVTKMAIEFGIKLPELDINQEEPDFITKINEKVVGIEVTRVFANKSNDIDEFYNQYKNIFKQALKELKSNLLLNKENNGYSINYDVYIDFEELWQDYKSKHVGNYSKKKRKTYIENKRNELKTEFKCLLQNRHKQRETQYIIYITEYKTTNKDDVITIANPILIKNLETLIEEREQENKYDLPIDLIETAMSGKETKLEKYKQQHPEVEEWILIIDLVHTSGLKFGKNFTIEKSNYDKIFVTQLLPPFAIMVYPN